MGVNVGTANQSVTQGQKRLSDISSYRLKPQYLRTIRLWENIIPLTALSQKLKNTKSFGDQTYFHMERDVIPQTVTVSGAHTSGTTSLILASGNGKYIRPRQLLHNIPTGEQIFVISLISGDTWLVKRGHGGSTAAAIADQTVLQILAMTDTDGNTAPTGKAVEPKKISNFLQIEKEAIELSGREMEADTFTTEDERAEAEMNAILALEQRCEKSMFFGRQNDGTDGAGVTTGGLEYFVSSNILDQAGAALTELQLNSIIQKIYNFNQGQDLVFFFGENIIAYLDIFARDRLRYQVDDKKFGIKVIKWQSSFGELNIVPHGMLIKRYDSNAAGLNYSLAGYGFGINLEHFKIANFKNRAMVFKKNAQTPDLDGIKDWMLNDFGTVVEKERAHMIIKGVPDPFN